MWAKITAALGILAAVLLGLLQREKRKAVEEELEDEKAATDMANNATEALLRGMKNENTDKDSRKRKFIDFS